MDQDKRIKATLVCLGAMFGAIAANPWFREGFRATCGVMSVGCGALLGYLLNPKNPPAPPSAPAPVVVTNAASDPIPTAETG